MHKSLRTRQTQQAAPHLVAAVKIIGEQAQWRLPGRQQSRHSAERALSRRFGGRSGRRLAVAGGHGEQQQEALHAATATANPEVGPQQATHRGRERRECRWRPLVALLSRVLTCVRLGWKMQCEVKHARMTADVAAKRVRKAKTGTWHWSEVFEAPPLGFRGTLIWLGVLT